MINKLMSVAINENKHREQVYAGKLQNTKSFWKGKKKTGSSEYLSLTYCHNCKIRGLKFTAQEKK